MEVSQNALAWMLCCSLLCGMALGLCYDVFRLTRMSMGTDLPQAAILLQQRLLLPERLRLFSTQSVSRRPRKDRKALKYIVLLVEDVIFCLICGVTIALLLYQTNDGQFRLSAVVVMLGGLAIYLLTIGRLIRIFSGVIVVIIRSALIWMLAIVAFPIAVLIRLLMKWTAPLRQRLKHLAFWALHTLKQKLQRRKQARLSRRTHKERLDTPLPRPSNGRHYFAAGRQKQGN
jgi:hypothetical protein